MQTAMCNDHQSILVLLRPDDECENVAQSSSLILTYQLLTRSLADAKICRACSRAKLTPLNGMRAVRRRLVVYKNAMSHHKYEFLLLCYNRDHSAVAGTNSLYLILFLFSVFSGSFPPL